MLSPGYWRSGNWYQQDASEVCLFSQGLHGWLPGAVQNVCNWLPWVNLGPFIFAYMFRNQFVSSASRGGFLATFHTFHTSWRQLLDPIAICPPLCSQGCWQMLGISITMDLQMLSIQEEHSEHRASLGSTESSLWIDWGVRLHGCFLKWWYPQIIHFNRVFHYKPSNLGYPYFWKHPHIRLFDGLWFPLNGMRLSISWCRHEVFLLWPWHSFF